MITYYFDTSAIAKRYLVEVGSTWVKNTIDPSTGNTIVICDLTPVEMFSLLARRRREGTITPQAEIAFQTDFLIHFQNQYLVTLLAGPVLLQARSLVTRHKLRTLDAVQLAFAQDAMQILNEPLVFVTGDKDLLAAAQKEGFQVDNPNLHP